MTQDNHKPEPATTLSAEKNTPKSRSLVLKKCFLAGAAAVLIVVVGLWLWQNNFQEKPSSDGMIAKEIRCNHLHVVVRSPDHADALIACEGARDAIEFLATQGLDVAADIAIDLLTRLPVLVSPSAAGCCLESEGRVLVLVYSEFRKFKTWFGIPIDRSLYRSFVSHEVAHLVAYYNFKISEPSIQAKEYIAYVTQFSTMESVLRKKVLSQFPCKAFEGDWQMSTTIYMFDCMGFGVRAYRHFLELADEHEYVLAILNGEALIE